ncbi:HORMA domain-containing protein [Gymnopilus junonius]|uniref:HORMA domain-containing protein n=1 Tax=Gymnopilus junonius TaxID=109634 RepID=A0A9P5TUQ8_GYMJU|nr:HORMA domain-containing protein [Gymnopilus junonius]
MQAQQTRTNTETISQTQSLAAVQTLLRASLGCITFLRNLLPDDNFSESYFTSVDEAASSHISLSGSSASQESVNPRRTVNGFKVMTIARGYTDEADKILNYLENGIFDALEKGYLRSFIFAIYLDNKDPNNIVEAYTFNFKYHTIPGSGVTLPVMSLASGQNVPLDKRKAAIEDPVSMAIMKGRTPTLKDVKMSVKSMLKTLIQAMHRMEDLPRRRFATFKVFYTDGTPLDYEPPNFQAGDVDKDRWFFMTHDLDEVPDRCSIGTIQTGHHSVKLSVTSIASYLPFSTVHDDATFYGTIARPDRSTLTPLQEAVDTKNQANRQLANAENRNLAWSAEDSVELGDADAEGDEDSGQQDHIQHPDGYYIEIDAISPIGVRNRDGVIEALPADRYTTEAQFTGVSEHVPKKLHEIVINQMPTNSGLEETQPLLLRPANKAPNPLSSLSSADLSMLSPISTAPTTPDPGPDFDPEMLKNMSLDAREDCNTELLDLETQVTLPRREPLVVETVNPRKNATIDRSVRSMPDNDLQCDCGILLEDESCFCEGGCRKWFHVWCMGYHTTDDERMPTRFICFDCRVRADISWELIKIDLYPRMLSKFKDLALFRRAIKVAQAQIKFTSFQFSKAFGGGVALGGEMLKKLESEGFILQESTALDDLGFSITSHSKKGKNNKGKGTTNKQARPRKNMQKPRYIFNKEILSKPQYLDAFKPDDQEIESRLLGVLEMTKEIRSIRLATNAPKFNVNTQTQDESQEAPSAIGTVLHKRPILHDESDTLESNRQTKRIKMSLAAGVDLAE